MGIWDGQRGCRPWGAPWPDQVAMEFFEVHALVEGEERANTARAKAPAEVTA